MAMIIFSKFSLATPVAGWVNFGLKDWLASLKVNDQRTLPGSATLAPASERILRSSLLVRLVESVMA